MVYGFDVNRVRLAWLGTGVVLSVAVIFVIHRYIGTFVFGLFFYYATRPVYERLYKRIGNRIIAASLSMAVMALPIVLLFGYVLAIALQELQVLSGKYGQSNFAQYQEILAPYFNVSQVATDPRVILENPEAINIELAQTVLSQGLNYLGFFFNAGLHTFVMILIGYYLLKDGSRLSRWFQAKFADDRGVLEEFVREVDRDFQKIFFGNILNAILTATLGAIVFTTVDILIAPSGVHIPYAPLMGLLAGAASLLPLFGLKLVYIPLTGYLAFSAYRTDPALLWFPAVFLLISFLLVDLVPEFALRPYISGRNLHIGAVILAYTFGPLIWGWYGLFLGPIILVLVVHFARIVVPEMISEETFAPYSVDPTYLVAPESTGEGPWSTLEEGVEPLDSAEAEGVGGSGPDPASPGDSSDPPAGGDDA